MESYIAGIDPYESHKIPVVEQCPDHGNIVSGDCRCPNLLWSPLYYGTPEDQRISIERERVHKLRYTLPLDLMVLYCLWKITEEERDSLLSMINSDYEAVNLAELLIKELQKREGGFTYK